MGKASADQPAVPDRVPDLEAARRLFSAFAAEDARDSPRTGTRTAVPGYAIQDTLGAGGGGVVYRAIREGSERPVALKLLNRRLGAGAEAQRAWRELQLLSDLHLPCLPRLLDYGDVEGRLYLVTDFVDGEDLLTYCAERSLERRERAEILAKVADAVQSLHEHGVVHRDLKPSNVIIDSHGIPIIIDLGIATLLEHDAMETLTVDGAPIGTPAFMAPEQARGERHRISTRTDVYGLGAMAYLVLTGKTPHASSATLHQAIRRVTDEDPRDPRSVDPSTPKALAAVLSKAVARRPEDRYASAAALAEDLRRWLRKEPVEAHPPSRWQRGSRWVLRHPIVTTTAACILIAVSIVGGGTWFAMWYGREPIRLTLTPDREDAVLLARNDNQLARWSGPFRDFDRLPEFVGRRLALIGFTDKARQWRGLFCAFDVNESLERPSWTATVEPSHLPARLSYQSDSLQLKARGFAYSWGAILDCFSESEGPEILVVLENPGHSQVLIRLYSLEGDLLFQACHDGMVRACQWMPASGLLVFSGIDDVGWEARGLEPAGGQYPRVLFAIRPKSGLIDRGWINRPDEERPRTTVAWYRTVRSTDPALGIKQVAVQPPELGDDATRQVRVLVKFECDPSCQTATLLVDDEGVEDVAGRVLTDLMPGQVPLDLAPGETLLVELPLATRGLPPQTGPSNERP